VGGALATAVLPANDVTRQYVAHRQSASRSSVGARDLGAFERGVSPLPTYSVSGRVTDTAGQSLANAQVTVTGGLSATTTTDGRGLYALAGVPAGGTVTVSPALPGHGFAPPSASFSPVGADLAADFTGGLTATVAPTVTMTAPLHGTVYTSPTEVTLKASASDSDGRIVRVDFYRDATLLGTDTTASFYLKVTLPVGTHTLTATAVDDRGAQTTSAPLVVTVVDPATAPVLMPALADTYVRADYTTRNYATSTLLEVRKSATTSYIREAYLAFDLTSAVTNRRVLLRLAGRLSSATAPVVGGVYAVASTTWTETGVTYEARPASGSTPLATFTVAGTTTAWVELDVTA
jgi:hypothetical protein